MTDESKIYIDKRLARRKLIEKHFVVYRDRILHERIFAVSNRQAKKNACDWLVGKYNYDYVKICDRMRREVNGK